MNDLIEIFGRADSERANHTARDAEVVDKMVDAWLLPLAKRIADGQGPAHTYAGGAAAKTKPQFIAELRLEAPEPADLEPRLRTALEKRSRKEPEQPEFHPYAVGVTIAQRASEAFGGHPAHIRWGFWTHAPKAGKRIMPPYRYLCDQLEWDAKASIVTRPVLNIKRFKLTLVGGLVELSTLTDADAIAAVTDRIATNLIALSAAIRK